MSSDPEQPKQDADPAAPTEVAEEGAGPKAAPPPSESGSIEVAVSGKVPVVESGASGSIDVGMSGATPVVVGDEGSAPITSGAVHAVAAAREQTGRTKRLTDAAKDAVSGGVTALGTSIGTIGGGIEKLGEKSRKVPIVGTSVSALGESLTSVGESLTELPRVASTRRGRLLVRSLVVGFLLVFAWITVIVALQLRGGVDEQIDFRPFAEKILIELSSGSEAVGQAYEKASPRFQEFVGKEAFVDDMTDLHDTVGKFKEIAAVNDTLVTRGPTGKVGRVSMTVAYEKGKTKASVSLHQHEGQWKLLGIGVEIPPEVQITQRQREERVQACKDPMDPKKCDLYVAANTILEQLRDGQAAQVWEAASPIFQKQEEKTRWVQIQRENQAQLGEFRRIIAVSEQRTFRSGNAVYDTLVEYTRSQGVRAIFGFTRSSKSSPWKLLSLKIVVPMPRADEGEPPKPLGESPTGNPPIPDEPPPEPPKPAGNATKPPAKKPKPAGNGTGSAPAPAGSGSAGSATKPAVDIDLGVKVGSGSS